MPRRRSRCRRSRPAPSRTTRRSRSAWRPRSSARCAARSPCRSASARTPVPASTGTPSSSSPGSSRGRSCGARRRCPRAPRSRPATARRSPKARSACPISDRSAAKARRGVSLPGRAPPKTAAAAAPAPAERAAELTERGVPAGASVGLTGLERDFDDRLSGTPGGVLYAGSRVLARKAPVPGPSVRTTIEPDIQRAAVEALAGRFGGIAVVAPRRGEILALAGIAQSAPQPPGSTFKIVTLAGVLQNHIAKRNDVFPYQTSTQIEGVDIQNANGESCGGSLRTSFAHSCNSVFAPLGAKLGAQNLVATAERFGFNQDPGPLGAARSTIPAPSEIGDDLAVGSSAIGQGKVLATPLQMALVAATIGNDGRRPAPTLVKGSPPKFTEAPSAGGARPIKSYMRTVGTDGTGGGGGAPPGEGGGKPGTAELRNTVKDAPAEVDQPPEAPGSDPDAWFTAFAPMAKPRLAVAVLLVGQGAGGDTAAPAARIVLEAGL